MQNDKKLNKDETRTKFILIKNPKAEDDDQEQDVPEDQAKVLGSGASVAKLKKAGWKVFYSGTYADKLTGAKLDEILARCGSKTQIIVGAGAANKKVLKLYAKDLCQVALAPTLSVKAAGKNPQGAAKWYNLANKAFGFALEKEVFLNPTDVCDESCEGETKSRLSWSLNAAGERLGNVLSIRDKSFKRFIFLKGALPKVELQPEEQVLRASPGIGGQIKESLVVDDGFKKVYDEALKTPLTRDDMRTIAETCNDKTQIVVAIKDVAT